MIRVLLADDHEVARVGLAHLLSAFPDVDLVATAADGETAVKLTAELSPDVVLMDIAMPGMGGIAAIRSIVQSDPSARVIAFSAHEDRRNILDAIDAGAVGYLLKGSEPGELVRGLEAAARGESPLAPRAATALIDARATRATSTELTSRERDVLQLLAAGLSNKQIARRLGISEKTVKGHLTSTFQRLGVSDRTQAALWAERNGLLRDPAD